MTTPIIRRVRPVRTKRNYSSFTLQEAMELVPAEKLTEWRFERERREPSPQLLTNLQASKSFNQHTSEQAKILLIDLVFLEILPRHPGLMVWKAAAIETDTLTGIADYVIAPNRAYLQNPLLCAVEAKKDDFEQGEIQCIVEMIACQQSNAKKNQFPSIHGIVSNGQGWQFYRLAGQAMVEVSEQFGIANLPELLGAVDYVCGECAKNVP